MCSSAGAIPAGEKSLGSDSTVIQAGTTNSLASGSVEAFSLFASAAVAKSTRFATLATRIITLGMSGVANAWAMSHTVDGVAMQVACVLAGAAVPCLIALSSITLARAVRT